MRGFREVLVCRALSEFTWEILSRLEKKLEESEASEKKSGMTTVCEVGSHTGGLVTPPLLGML